MDTSTGLVRLIDITRGALPPRNPAVMIPVHFEEQARQCAEDGIPLDDDRNPHHELRAWARKQRQDSVIPSYADATYRLHMKTLRHATSEAEKLALKRRRKIQKQNKQNKQRNKR